MLNNLGETRHALGRTEEAEADYRRALGIYRGLVHPNPDIASVCFNLGDILRKRGKTDETLALLA